MFWVDSKRLTERQMAYLRGMLEDGMPNVRLRDLREIPEYDKEPLYNKGETNPNWRQGSQHSLIWRQVDAAKILVCLQGRYDQTFFSDLDHSHLGINSPRVQEMLKNHGLMIGSGAANAVWIENQLWGFTPERRGFFEKYYENALGSAMRGWNAFDDLQNQVDDDLVRAEGVALEKFCLPIRGDGTQAEQPGHLWREGHWAESSFSSIPSDRLAEVFNRVSSRAAVKAEAVVAPASAGAQKPAAMAGAT